MKRAINLLFGVGLVLALSSCETNVDRHKAGGGAFDDSQLGRRLDSNNPNLDDNTNEKGKIAPRSYEQLRYE